ncbi:lysosomal proton-coupled steroid conjugate and bile acid symporter SLC46A3-like [Tubulanus polymorphus]|uniref:lysosomal proton-coupled steroid conjugate and bile acid symporter SLC46A3-like n=1 Tax=Tubulanus polymorphus TaxID=672921 RepID=UPI003DA6A989
MSSRASFYDSGSYQADDESYEDEVVTNTGRGRRNLKRVRDDDFTRQKNNAKATDKKVLVPPATANRDSYFTFGYFVEPIALMHSMSVSGVPALVQEYLMTKFGNITYLSQTDTSRRCLPAQNDTKLIEYIEREAAKWTLYTNLASIIPAVFITLLFGPAIIRKGHRWAYVIPIAGSLLKSLLYSFTDSFDWPVWTLLIGHFVEGICGHYGLLYTAILSFVANSSSEKNRGLRMFIIAVFVNLGIGFGDTALVVWARESGFLFPYMTVITILLVNFFYCIFLFPASNFDPEASGTSVEPGFRQLQQVRKLFTETRNKRRTLLILTYIAFVFNILPRTATRQILVYFQMNLPLCWNYLKIMIFKAYRILFKCLSGLILVLISRGRVPDLVVAMIGAFSSVSETVADAFASDDIMMYFVPVIGALTLVTAPFLRTYISKLIPPDEYANAFGFLNVFELVFVFTGYVTAGYVYYGAFSFIKPGFVYFFFTVIGIAVIVIIIFLIRNQQMRRERLPSRIRVSTISAFSETV